MAETLVVDLDAPDYEQALNEARQNVTAQNDNIRDQEVQTPEAEYQEPIDVTPPAEKTTPAPEAVPPTDTVDYAKYFETLSEGYVKDDETFKVTITKAKRAEELEKELNDTKASIPQFKNDESKAFYELLVNGDVDALDAYRAEMRKDYKTMSDIDVVRENLAKKNPNWSKDEVELEMRYQYGQALEKIDLENIDKEDEDGKPTYEYLEAVRHNKEVDNNLMKLQRDARDARPELLDRQSKIELPKINKAEPAPQQQGPTEQEIADIKAKWEKSVDETMPTLSDLKLDVDGKEVVYVASDKDKKALADKIKNFNIFNYAKTRGWVNEDGTSNPLKIAEDVRKLDDFENITKSFIGQAKTGTTKEVIGKIKNLDDSYVATDGIQAFDNLADAVHAAKVKAGWKK